ncbi:hypothetical protein PSEUDO8O_150444 [Pseudomonas sp. 8O]|nr:hypothetical protein PSEUDO8O_150444 [Pseudomonas sp. 8O]
MSRSALQRNAENTTIPSIIPTLAGQRSNPLPLGSRLRRSDDKWLFQYIPEGKDAILHRSESIFI